MFESWPEPEPFIESINDELIINPRTAARLEEIKESVIVVAIAGIYRTGKSYLMNRLAGQSNGFALGSTVQSKTKGIWVWCRRHPDYPNKVLVLLDTEGLSDAEKADKTHDMMIFSLAVLLCSTFVFNAIGKIDQDMIDNLYFVTELTDRIRAKSGKKGTPDDEEESCYEAFTEFFPEFVLAVRDFTLDLELDGQAITADEYFDHILKLKKGGTKSAVNYNLPREAIRSAFRSHHCFVFTRPVQDEKLFRRLEEISDDDLAPTFKHQSNKFCNHVLQKTRPKKLTSGQEVNGRTLLALAEQYVHCMNNGSVPCIESTIALVAQNENRRLEEECRETYLQAMTQHPFPISEFELNTLHTQTYTKTMAYFRKHAVFDKDGEFLKKIMDILTEAFKDVVAENLSASNRKCWETIDKIYSDIVKEKMRSQQYTTVGGYKMYDEDMKSVIENYKKTPNLGSKSEDVLNKFLEDRENERNTIMQADTQMSESEKKIELETKKRQAVEMQAEATAKELKAQKDRVDNLIKEHEEQFKKARVEFHEKEVQQKKDMEELLQKRLEEQEKLHKEGMNRKAQEMQDEIEGLKKKTQFQTGLNSLMDVVDRVLGAVHTIMSIKKTCDSIGGVKASASGTQGSTKPTVKLSGAANGPTTEKSAANGPKPTPGNLKTPAMPSGPKPPPPGSAGGASGRASSVPL